MLYIGYLIILDGKNIKKKSVLEISIFQLPRIENCIHKQVVPWPPWEPPPTPK